MASRRRRLGAHGDQSSEEGPVSSRNFWPSVPASGMVTRMKRFILPIVVLAVSAMAFGSAEAMTVTAPFYRGSLAQSTYLSHLGGAAPGDPAIKGVGVWTSATALHVQVKVARLDARKQVSSTLVRTEDVMADLGSATGTSSRFIHFGLATSSTDGATSPEAVCWTSSSTFFALHGVVMSTDPAHQTANFIVPLTAAAQCLARHHSYSASTTSDLSVGDGTSQNFGAETASANGAGWAY